ncbi:MAG: hypothetical protein M3082_21675, partial [Candidatus Dormibacteraeota bacterium]|nr:hypothetical protein [Candidatus Dormibacteraeota bacterium]
MGRRHRSIEETGVGVGGFDGGAMGLSDGDGYGLGDCCWGVGECDATVGPAHAASVSTARIAVPTRRRTDV